MGEAKSNLNMSNYSIIGSTIDASNTSLTIGGTTTTSLILGKASQTTNILGNFQVNNTAGNNGQVLTSNGTLASWQNTAWVGNATTDLNMGGRLITNSANININSGKSVVIAGTNPLTEVTLDNSGLTVINTGTYIQQFLYQGQLQLQDLSRKYIKLTPQNINLNGSNGTIGQVLTKNNSNEIQWLNNAGSWVGTATSNLNMSIYSIISPNIDASNTTLTIGGTNATSLILGKASQTTNILGNLQINSSAGSNGQVLTSNGTLVSWQTPIAGATGATGDTGPIGETGVSGWISTAESDLNMATYVIGGTSTLNISTPILPSYSYDEMTGTTIGGTIGQIISNGLLSDVNITNNTTTSLINITITNPGIYMIIGTIYLINLNGKSVTYRRIITNIGSGLINNKNNDIGIDTKININMTSTIENHLNYNLCCIFSTNVSTIVNLSVQVETPTISEYLKFTDCKLTAVKIS